MHRWELEKKTRLKRSQMRTLDLPVLKPNGVVELDYRRTFQYKGKEVHRFTTSSSFQIAWLDLVAAQDLLDLADFDYNAFGVFLPKRVILEVLDFHKDHNDEFSALVKEYPFIQLIFSQWLTIKLYRRHIELSKKPGLEYRAFMQDHFYFTHNNKPLNIYEAIAKMKIQELNHKAQENYSLISSATAVDYETITLYDFIYDMIPNSIQRVFLKDEATMIAYLPLKQEELEYKDVEYANAKSIFKTIYGEERAFDKTKIEKEWHCLKALSARGYQYGTWDFFGYDKKTELLAPRAKQRELGIGYDELWELTTRSQKDLDYPKIWDLQDVEQPDLEKYCYDEEDKTYYPEGMAYHKIILDKQRVATWEDIVWLCSDDYLEHHGFGHPRAVEFSMDARTRENINKQHFIANALIVQNNFHSQNAVFETMRQTLQEARGKVQKDDWRDQYDFELKYSLWHAGRFEWYSYWYGFTMEQDIFLAFRANHTLALCFLNAYDEE